VASWSETDKIRAERYAMGTLEGAGIAARTIVEAGAFAVHWRRVTSELERAYVAKTSRWRETRD
jgi:hypothetical protein